MPQLTIPGALCSVFSESGTAFRIEEHAAPASARWVPRSLRRLILAQRATQGRGRVRPNQRPSDAAQRTERPADPDRPRHANGTNVPLLVDSGALVRGVAGERFAAGAGEAPVGTAARLPRQRGPARPDRRVLRPPRHLAVVRPQRGEGPALPLPR